jgi:D-alanine--poly(phosphoribitol) ligase subunit 2
METDTRHELRAQVADVVSERAGIDVPDTSTDLLEAGLIDSLALVTLIVALEETFGVQLPLDDFDVDHFRSVDAMSDFLASVGAAPAA